jgi:fibronectin type 3 domain-containing protein
VTLTWTPSTSGDIESYNIHQGTSSGVYTTVISAGNVNQYVETGLTSGQQMYFVVTAVSATGVESVVSNEVTTIVP